MSNLTPKRDQSREAPEHDLSRETVTIHRKENEDGEVIYTFFLDDLMKCGKGLIDLYCYFRGKS